MPEQKIYRVVIPVVVRAPAEIEGGPAEDLVVEVPAYSKAEARKALGKALGELIGTSLNDRVNELMATSFNDRVNQAVTDLYSKWRLYTPPVEKP